VYRSAPRVDQTESFTATFQWAFPLAWGQAASHRDWMKMLRWFALVLVIALVVFLGGSFLLPDAIQVKRSIPIQAPAPVILEAVTNLETWQDWEPWGPTDETMEVTFGAVRSGEGASYSWEGSRIGKGSVEILQVEPLAAHFRYTFNENARDPAFASFQIDPIEAELCAVTWTFRGELGSNPIDRYLALLVKPMIETSYEEGLSKLKNLLETAPAGAAE